MSLSVVERRKTTIAQPNLPVYQNEKTMRAVSRALVLLGILLAGGTVVGGYFFHASPLYATNPNLFLIITIGGSALTIGSFVVALYLNEKVYWKDPDYCDSLFEKDKDIESLTMLLRRSDLPELSQTAIDGELLTLILKIWFEKYIKSEPEKITAGLIQDFIREFKWRPFEIGILSKETQLFNNMTVGQVLNQSLNLIKLDSGVNLCTFAIENALNIQKYLES